MTPFTIICAYNNMYTETQEHINHGTYKTGMIFMFYRDNYSTEMHFKHLQSLTTFHSYTKLSLRQYFFYFSYCKTSNMKLNFSKETFRVIVVIIHVALQLQGAAETRCGPSVSFSFFFLCSVCSIQMRERQYDSSFNYNTKFNLNLSPLILHHLLRGV